MSAETVYVVSQFNVWLRPPTRFRELDDAIKRAREVWAGTYREHRGPLPPTITKITTTRERMPDEAWLQGDSYRD